MAFKKSNEAFWWSLFSAGGVASAMFMPAFLVVVGVVLPSQYFDDPRASYEHLLGLVTWWPVRLLLLGVIGSSFFHAGHRIRHVMIDLGWRHHTAPLSLLCYGGALAGAATAAWIILTLPAVPQ